MAPSGNVNLGEVLCFYSRHIYDKSYILKLVCLHMMLGSWGHKKLFTNCAGRDELGSILLFTIDGYLQNVRSIGKHIIRSTLVKGFRLIFYGKFTLLQ